MCVRVRACACGIPKAVKSRHSERAEGIFALEKPLSLGSTGVNTESGLDDTREKKMGEMAR